MNKYQEALNYFLDREEGDNMTVTIDWLDNAEMLQELIDRETPMKPYVPDDTSTKIYMFTSKCTNCGNSLSQTKKVSYCPRCGQRIDWSVENE